jgi:hypothetical protein
MMTCKELAELLMAYCDGELPKEYCDLICQHIRLCRPCGHYMETYRLTIQICRDLPQKPPPQHLLDKLREAVKRRGDRPCGE